MFIFGLSYLIGCQALSDKWQEIQDATNGFVVGGQYWGVEERSDLEETTFADAGSMTVYLANANISANLTANPASRGTVMMSSSSINNFRIPEGEPGEYNSSSEDGLVYYQGDYITLDITHSDIDHAIGIEAPYAPNFTLDSTYPAGVPLTVDLVGQGFVTAFVAVFHMDVEAEPTLTYDNRPADVAEMYEVTHPNDENLQDEQLNVVEIPADAFPENGNYLVGIAGVLVASEDDMDNINKKMSSFVAGKFRFEAVCVSSEPDDPLCLPD